jgi:O-antigen/teichoic acid export membrane protein
MNSRGPQAVRRLVIAVFAAQLSLLALTALGFILLRDNLFVYLQTQIAGVQEVKARADLSTFVAGNGGFIIAALLMMLLTGIGYDILMAYLSSFFKQKAWNSIALAAGLLPPVLTTGAILAGWDVGGVLAAGVLSPTIATALVAWQVVRHQREITSVPHQPDDGRWLPPGFLRYCAVSLLMTATDFLASAEFVVFFVKELVAVAVIKAGVSIVKMMLSYLYTPMVGVQVPLFTRVRAGEGGTLNGAYQSIVRLQVLVLVPGGAGLMLLAYPIFSALFPKYVQAAPLVWVLVPCLFLECLLTTAHNVLIVYEHMSIIIISRVLTLISVPLVLLLTPTMGLIGAALAFGLARVVAGTWVTLSGVRLLGIRWPWRFTGRVIFATVGMSLLVAMLAALVPPLPPQAPIVQRLLGALVLGGVAAAGAGGFLIALRAVGGLDPQDREQLARTRLPGKRWLLRAL